MDTRRVALAARPVGEGCIQMPMAGLRLAVFAGRQSVAPSGKGGSIMRTRHNWLVAGGLALALATTVQAVTMAPAGWLLAAVTRRSG
jgi:hypothetical protein